MTRTAYKESSKMKLVFVILIQVIVWYQITETKDIHRNDYLRGNLRENAVEKADAFSRILEVYDQKHLRSISDLWQSIKNSAINAWNHIKNIANKTKEKIMAFIEDLKDKIDQIQSKFEERLKDLQDKMNEIIDKAISTSQNIGKCLKEDKDAINKIAKEILKNVTICISDNIGRLRHLEQKLTVELNEKDFESRLDEQLDACVKDDINEECLHGVRKEIFSEMEAIENEVLQNGSETRGIAEDLLNTVISCTTEGLITASSNITMEAAKIIKCAAEETESQTAGYMKLVM